MCAEVGLAGVDGAVAGLAEAGGKGGGGEAALDVGSLCITFG